MRCWRERRAAAWGVAAGFGLVGLWLLLDLPSSIAAINGKGMPALVLIALVAVVIHGLGRARERAPSAPALLLTVACVGLAGAATVLEARGVAPAALALAAATLGVLPWLPAAPGAPGWIVTLAGGGPLSPFLRGF